MTSTQKYDDFEDGYYLLSKMDGTERSIVRLYMNPDENVRGLGFNTADGGSFLPLTDLSDDSLLQPVSILVKPNSVSPMIELPDGSGCFTASFPLPKNHWLYAPGHDDNLVPPEGIEQIPREAIIAAARWAIRAATMNGQEPDFDPDAMVLNFAYALRGPLPSTVSITKEADDVSDPSPPWDTK